jgi:hypothetical protein
MALRPAPKRKPADYEKVDDLQKEIFGLEREVETPLISKSKDNFSTKIISEANTIVGESIAKKPSDNKPSSNPSTKELKRENSPLSRQDSGTDSVSSDAGNTFNENLSDLETIAVRIVSSKAGQGRNTTRPFSLPRTLIIDTTRLKSKFRTIDEQFTQNVIIDFLLREALAATTPENYKVLRAAAFESVKRPDETTRRSLTVTEEVIYQMSELKAGINLETGRKYSNDEIFSTLLALGVSWLYRNGVLS